LAGDRLPLVSHRITLLGINETDREITFYG